MILSFLLAFEMNSQGIDSLTVSGQVTFITVDEVYFNFGGKNGVEAGDSVTIYKYGKEFVKLNIVAVSDSVSIAEVGKFKEKIWEVKIGDTAIVRKVKVVKAESPQAKAPVIKQEVEEKPAVDNQRVLKVESRRRTSNFYGRVSFQNFYSISTSGFSYNRPGVFMVLNSELSDKFLFNFYARYDQSFTKTQGRTLRESRFSIYRASFEFRISRFAVSAGRIFHNFAPGIGSVDGFSVGFNSPGSAFGFIGGTQPDRVNSSFNRKDLKFAFFISRELRLGKFYSRTTISYGKVLKDSKVDEEFMYVQSNLSLSRYAFLYLSSQFDFNDISPAGRVRKFKFRNLFFSLNTNPLSWAGVGIDYGLYRNVYLFETMKSIPDSVFDKRARQDLTGRIYLNLPLNLGLNFSETVRFIEGNAKGEFVTSAFLTARDVLAGFNFRFGYSQINSNLNKIESVNFSVGRDMFNGVLYLNCDVERYDYRTLPGDAYSTTVLRGSAMVNFLRSFSINLNFERGWEKGFMRSFAFFELGYRF